VNDITYQDIQIHPILTVDRVNIYFLGP